MQCVSAPSDDHDLRVVLRHPVVAHDVRLDAVLRELAEELERDVRDDLDVHPRVVVDLHPDDRVHVRDVPPALELAVRVRPLDDAAELAVRALRDADAHAVDGLRGGEPGIALRLVGRGRLDPLDRLGQALCVEPFCVEASASSSRSPTATAAGARAASARRRRARRLLGEPASRLLGLRRLLSTGAASSAGAGCLDRRRLLDRGRLLRRRLALRGARSTRASSATATNGAVTEFETTLWM